MEITLKQLKSLLRTLEEGGASEFEYEDDKYRLRLTVGGGAAQVSALHAATLVEGAPGAGADPGVGAEDEQDVAYITSPFVGTFYRAPAPDAEPFCEIDKSVRKGQTLCIVEAMKLMNEIESEQDGTVLDVLVENGASVEFGQKLFKLKTA